MKNQCILNPLRPDQTLSEVETEVQEAPVEKTEDAVVETKDVEEVKTEAVQ